jgi:hypothetical protein
MNIRDSINSVLAKLVRNPILGRPVRIIIAIWQAGDPPEYVGQPTVFNPGTEPVSSDFDSVIRGIEECLVRHENTLREIESSLRAQVPPEQAPKQNDT